MTDAGTPIILYGRLYTKYQFAISEVDTFAFPRNGAVYSQGNEVIVPASGETAEDIARASAVEKSGVLLGGDLNILRPFDFINPLFLALAISNGEPQKELAKKAQGKSVVHIHNTDIQEVTIAYPSRTEQDRIVSVFRQLDNLITLHQRQSFSHSTPDISLSVQLIHPFYTSSWEQRKLGEVIRLNGRIGFRGYTEKDIVSKDDGGVLTFSPTNIVDNKLTTNCKNTYITRFKYDESPEIKIHNGDILFVKTGSTLGKSALVTGLSEDATLNPQVVVMRTNNLNVEFLAAMLVTNAIISQVNSAKIGGAVPTLTETRIKDFDVAIPVSEAEKEQIGQFFSQLDNLITLHQRKGKAAVSGCSNDANNSKGVCCKARNFGYKCHKKDESK